MVGCDARRPPSIFTPRLSHADGRSWPDYARCLQGAPPNRGGTGPDVSKADFFFALASARRAWSVEDIAAELVRLSEKARENGERYAVITAQNAAAAVERERQRSRA